MLDGLKVTDAERERKAKRWLRDHTRRRELGVKANIAAGMDEFSAMVHYDSTQAVQMRQREVLKRIGAIDWDGWTPVDAFDAVVAERLSKIICGMARIGVYFSGTDHLTDREMLSRLEMQILNEVVRFVPPNDSMSEFIDMNPTNSKLKVRNRDKNLPRPARMAQTA